MKDVHQKARDRAQQRVASPPDIHNTLGSPQVNGNMAFASERERAKEALRTELNNYSSNNIHKIAALTQTTDDGRILRVAAYCRVSTDDEDQVSSMELQKKAYKELITNNPNWIYYGTFVDDGYSGTNTEHRRAFQLMMKHAEQGKFDMIVTKSVSRFARNLIDCITWVRALQDHDPPIAVYFEQEGINTLNTSSNIILFVLAMVAEEESHMKSEAMLLSLEWRFSRGRFLLPSILGYDKVIDRDETGTIIRRRMCVNEDEARTIRLMYYMLVNGASRSAPSSAIPTGRPARFATSSAIRSTAATSLPARPGRLISTITSPGPTAGARTSITRRIITKPSCRAPSGTLPSVS